MATMSQWVAAARLRTLPMAVVPVVTGSAAAHTLDGFHLGRALLAMVVALALQVGVNYANDYSDGIRGTDDDRVGPFRLTASKQTAAKNVKNAAFGCFGVAMLAGFFLVALSGTWWFLLVGAAAVAAAWFYTGGSKPYGYLGLGEVFVFVFFGLVAGLGTTYETLKIGVKPYPSCRYTHAAIDALIAMRREHNLTPDQIRKVEIGLHRNGITLTGDAATPSNAGARRRPPPRTPSRAGCRRRSARRCRRA